MSISYRIFVVHDGQTIEPLSQASFDAFWLRGEPSLVRFADRAINLAMVICALKDRKPDRIVRIDTQRVHVTADGSMDQERTNEAIHLALNRAGKPSASNAPARVTGPVIDATAKFNERRWAKYHPQLSGTALGRIHRALFRGAAS